MSGRTPSHTLWATFRVPAELGALSLLGLVGALLDDGVWDALGAACLAAPVAAVVWACLRRRI